MSNKYSNPCIHCGKERIVSKTWSEYSEGRLMECTDTVCPDPVCQKSVEKELKSKSDHLKSVRLSSEQRRKESLKNKRKLKSKAKNHK